MKNPSFNFKHIPIETVLSSLEIAAKEYPKATVSTVIRGLKAWIEIVPERKNSEGKNG